MSGPDALAQLAAAGLAGPFDVALVAGTGLGGLADALEDRRALAYAELPGFPRPGVSGHAGRLVAGSLAGRRVLVLQGRAHAYESGDPAVMRRPLEVVAALGTRTLVLTNASGSLDPARGPGSLVLLADHLNLTGLNPLVGEASDRRFVPMVDAYDPVLRAALRRAAAAEGIGLTEGVYAWFPGPSFETPAEVRAAGRLGADLVGMSTVPETILARFLGMRVAAVSVVTNLAAGIEGGAPSHRETKDVAARVAGDLARLLRAALAQPEFAEPDPTQPDLTP